MPQKVTRFMAAVVGLVVVVAIALPSAEAVAAHRSKPVHHATLRAAPRCVSVRAHYKRKLTITLAHGVRGVRYTFALVPLFGRGGYAAPNAGRYRAGRDGSIKFTYPAPNKTRDAGRWQVSATRKVGRNAFKLAALTHILVKRGKCKRK